MRRLFVPLAIITTLAAGTAAFTQSFQVTLGTVRAPEQPIPFSHKIHAGTLQMDCLYCHYAAGTSQAANIPTLETCMGCHKVASVERPNIQRLAGMYAQGEPPEWTEVYRLPDHVKFNHVRHVKAGVACQTCHGPVQEMDVVYQYSSLKMGWCIDCHRKNLDHPEKPASMDCLVCHH